MEGEVVVCAGYAGGADTVAAESCCWSWLDVLATWSNGCGTGGLLGVSGGKRWEEKGMRKGGVGGVAWMAVCGGGVATRWQTGGWAANTVGGGS